MTALPELERRLTQAAERRWDAKQQGAAAPSGVAGTLSWRNGSGDIRREMVALVVAVLLAGGAGVAAASGLIPFGDPAPIHSTIDVDAASLRTVAPVVDDPAGGPPWTVRAFEVGAGSCLQIGRLQGDVFGLVGADGRFHAQDPRAGARGCGGQLAASGDLMSTVASAGDPNDLRSLIFGVLGPDADSLAYVPPAGPSRMLELTPTGAYLLVTKGKQPPPGELVVKYRDGETRRAATNLAGLSSLPRSG
jgi:hypothetical protein